MHVIRSKSPLTDQVYEIAADAQDRVAIDQFLAAHPGKPVVVVQGLGFVGSVMSLVVANALTEEYAVIGVDVLTENSYWKIQSINNGVFPVQADDPKVELFYHAAQQKRNLLATFDPYAYSKADFIVVDINLDVQKQTSESNELLDYSVDLGPFKKAMQAIGQNCKEDCLILVETTVPPGTCQKIVKPIIEECLVERGLPTDQIKIGHSYERVMPGPKYIDSIQNFYRVYSGVDEASRRATEAFLRTIISTDEYPLTQLGNTNATEMAKVLENSYRAMNIGFMVEWTRFAEEAGVNLYEVVNAIRMRPTHKNMMLPGIGVGGYCLTKDPLLASWAKKELFGSSTGLSQSENGVATNDRMPHYAFDFLRKVFPADLKDKQVLLLGVSYLSDVGDTRYTPVEGFYKRLIQAETQVSLHDPYVRYWEETQVNVSSSLEQLLEHSYDIIVITTGHSIYRGNQQLLEHVKTHPSVLLVDTIGIFDESMIQDINRHARIKVIGRGDL